MITKVVQTYIIYHVIRSGALSSFVCTLVKRWYSIIGFVVAGVIAVNFEKCQNRATTAQKKTEMILVSFSRFSLLGVLGSWPAFPVAVSFMAVNKNRVQVLYYMFNFCKKIYTLLLKTRSDVNWTKNSSKWFEQQNVNFYRSVLGFYKTT